MAGYFHLLKVTWCWHTTLDGVSVWKWVFQLEMINVCLKKREGYCKREKNARERLGQRGEREKMKPAFSNS